MIKVGPKVTFLILNEINLVYILKNVIDTSLFGRMNFIKCLFVENKSDTKERCLKKKRLMQFYGVV